MKMRNMRKTVALVFMAVVILVGTGCDKAEKALEMTDLGSSAEITKLVGKAVESLGGIKDLDSAKAALPALKGIDGDLGQLVAKVKDMSPDQKEKLAGVVKTAMPGFEGAVKQVQSIQGVGSIVGPTLESLKGKLKGLI